MCLNYVDEGHVIEAFEVASSNVPELCVALGKFRSTMG